MKNATSKSINSSLYNLSIHNQLLGGKQLNAVFDIYSSYGIQKVVIEPKSERLSLYTDDPNQLSTDRIHYRLLPKKLVRNPDGNYPIPGLGIFCGQFSNNVVCIAYDRSHDVSNGKMWSVIEQSLPSNILVNLVIESSPCGFKLYYYSPRLLTGTILGGGYSQTPLKLIGNGQLSACWPNIGYTPIHGCFLTIKPLTRREENDLFQILKKVVTNFAYTWKSPKIIRKPLSLN